MTSYTGMEEYENTNNYSNISFSCSSGDQFWNNSMSRSHFFTLSLHFVTIFKTIAIVPFYRRDVLPVITLLFKWLDNSQV